MSYDYSTFDPSKYGLTKTDEKGSPDDGIINDGKGNYYKIEGFERQQKDDLDTDKLGKSSGLEALAKEHTDFDPSNFNTSNDVQGALRKLAGAGGEAAAPEPERRLSWNEAVAGGHLSQNVMDAIERTENWKKSKHVPNELGLFDIKMVDPNTSNNEMTDEAKAAVTNNISNKVAETMQDKV